jgi:hypothetical protein
MQICLFRIGGDNFEAAAAVDNEEADLKSPSVRCRYRALARSSEANTHAPESSRSNLPIFGECGGGVELVRRLGLITHTTPTNLLGYDR